MKKKKTQLFSFSHVVNASDKNGGKATSAVYVSFSGLETFEQPIAMSTYFGFSFISPSLFLSPVFHSVCLSLPSART